MSNEFEEYERACVKINEENAKLLADFEQWLGQKGLAPKTIIEHVKNAEFYINTFMREKGQIGVDDLQELKDTIKEEMPEWLQAVED